MIKIYWNAVDLAGNALPGATVQVINFLTGVNAPIYEDDETTPLLNPMTADSQGRVGFKIDAGKYNILVEKDGYSSLETEFTVIEDPSVAYYVNDSGGAMVYGEVGYFIGNGEVGTAASNSTTAVASAACICLESTLANGSTGRFRLMGPVPGITGGAFGAIGYLAQDGTITTVVPSVGAGDTHQVLLGRFSDATTFNFNPSYPQEIF